MVKQIQAAQKAARKAIEATYFGTLTVTELQKVKNEKSKLMEESEVVSINYYSFMASGIFEKKLFQAFMSEPQLRDKPFYSHTPATRI